MEMRRATEAEHRLKDSYARELLLPRKFRDEFEGSPVAEECGFVSVDAQELGCFCHDIISLFRSRLGGRLRFPLEELRLPSSEERRAGKGCGSTGRSRWWPVH